MNAAEAWGVGVIIAAPICFIAGFLTSRSARERAEREEREDAEREVRKREVREWRERQRQR